MIVKLANNEKKPYIKYTMCDCCKKIIVQNEIGIPGATGPAGVAPIVFETNNFISGAATTGLDFTHTLTTSGTYIVQLEYFFSHTGATDITTQLVKNGSLETLNANYQHDSTINAINPVITYTHTAKIVAVTTNTIGYKITTPAEGMNGSLTIIKIA